MWWSDPGLLKYLSSFNGSGREEDLFACFNVLDPPVSVQVLDPNNLISSPNEFGYRRLRQDVQITVALHGWHQVARIGTPTLACLSVYSVMRSHERSSITPSIHFGH